MISFNRIPPAEKKGQNSNIEHLPSSQSRSYTQSNHSENPVSWTVLRTLHKKVFERFFVGTIQGIYGQNATECLQNARSNLSNGDNTVQVFRTMQMLCTFLYYVTEYDFAMAPHKMRIFHRYSRAGPIITTFPITKPLAYIAGSIRATGADKPL